MYDTDDEYSLPYPLFAEIIDEPLSVIIENIAPQLQGL